MGNFDYDNYSDREGDDSWEADINEFDWERYLQREDDEVTKYQKLYNKLIRSQNRLDEVALFMGWETGNAAEKSDHSEEIPQLPLSEHPYTLHKHPLFVANKAIHGSIQEMWLQQATICSENLSALQALELQNSLSKSDYYGQLAVVAIDIGDYSLAIAYFKRGMSQINATFSLFEPLLEIDTPTLSTFVKQARIRLFDLRDIWLRVSSDCRVAIANRTEED